MSPRVFLNIVTWNSMDYMPDLLRSINNQTFDPFQVLIVDNASNDDIEPYVRENYPDIALLRNMRNLGFAGAHNQGMRYAIEHWPKEDLDNRYILVTNPDIILLPEFIESLVAYADNHPEVGAFGGKVLRAFGENLQDEALKETVQSDRFDTAGLKPHRNLRFTERGAGLLDEGQYDEIEPVFGISGALVLYRASALRDVMVEGEYFDEDFFAYKEDVDLAWRLQLAGWDAHYVPDAIAYHYRGMYSNEDEGFLASLKRKMSQSSTRGYYSTRNHFGVLTKNASVLGMLRRLPWFGWQECKRLGYTCMFDPKNIKAYFEVLKRTPKMLKKRRKIMQNATRSPHDVLARYQD